MKTSAFCSVLLTVITSFLLFYLKSVETKGIILVLYLGFMLVSSSISEKK
jgi:hypothetical protein